MIELNTIQIKVDGRFAIKAVKFTEVTKKQMLSINKFLGAQAFQEKYIDAILYGYKDGDKLIPLFYKDGHSSFIEHGDWLYVKDGEVYAVYSFSEIVDDIMNMCKESEVSNE